MNEQMRCFLQCLTNSIEHSYPKSEDDMETQAEIEKMGVYPDLTDEKRDRLDELREMIEKIFNEPGEK